MFRGNYANHSLRDELQIEELITFPLAKAQVEHSSLISTATNCAGFRVFMKISSFLCFQMHHSVRIDSMCAYFIPTDILARNQPSMSAASVHLDVCRLWHLLQEAAFS
jgi:hypothetical protein